jgi:2-polyprenyl-3-methyl-5-hydroxy-6-metoxy-1,4-benzoquinol methylase
VSPESIDLDDPELDPRLAAQYDVAKHWGDDDDFFLALVHERPGARVVDLGCGTGRLTTAIASAGHSVTGVDPNPAFLSLAQRKPGGDRVAWVRGTSADLPSDRFDVALMTSHVAQVFRSDDEWAAVLGDLRRALVAGGRLAFDTRDPAARAWEAWGAGELRSTLPDGSVLHGRTSMRFADEVAWFDATMVIAGRSLPDDVALDAPVRGATWSRASWGYRFRDADAVQRSVEHAGFCVERLLGGWHGEPLGGGTGEIVVVARA